MWSSAIASSSRVVIPARTEPRSSSSVRPTTRPAARMPSICSGVLISTPRSRQPIARRLPVRRSALGDDVEGVEDPLGDLVDLAHAVDLDEEAAGTVDVDEGRGLLG